MRYRYITKDANGNERWAFTEGKFIGVRIIESGWIWKTKVGIATFQLPKNQLHVFVSSLHNTSRQSLGIPEDVE